ncbi:hypothetical protein Dda_4953 [Drechslerella dactyloides]|uniref:Uncharacterized protein n=1 Tax=Drechslerella dactyloides TaxID=74499 RepID=A0AAD6NJI2_DREDA|nr:hypothetical protein Dda_4953 [Drechslerella dactyloides]
MNCDAEQSPSPTGADIVTKTRGHFANSPRTPSKLRHVTTTLGVIDVTPIQLNSDGTGIMTPTSPKPLLSPTQRLLITSTYISRVHRSRMLHQRHVGIYEKIHTEWIQKALLRQAKNLQWDPKTGEPLFSVRRSQDDLDP